MGASFGAGEKREVEWLGIRNSKSGKSLCGLGVSAVNKVYRRGAETLRGFLVVEWGRIDGGQSGDKLRI